MNAAGNIRAQFAGAYDRFALDVAFEAPARGVTALFGPSGCGKTTILRCMAGLARMRGVLKVGDDIWQDDAQGLFRKTHQRPIGYVFQEASLFARLSVRDNLMYGARRVRDAGAREHLAPDDVIALLGIDHLLDRAPGALSGGERQRVAVGRALLSRPQLLLMDEPLSALDTMTKDELLPYFDALHEKLAIPVIYVSHDIGEVARLADHVVLLSAGRKVAEGAVEDILERLDLQPETGRFEAGVILTARVGGHDHGFHMTHLDHHGQAISIPFVNVGEGENVRLRIRARDVALATRRPEDISIRNVLAGQIADIAEDSGTAYAEVLVDVGGGRLRARITRESVADLALAPGREVFALIKSIAFDGR